MLDTVWRLAEKDFDIDAFIGKYPFQEVAIVFRRGERRRNGVVYEKSGCNIIVSEQIDSNEHVKEIQEFLARYKEAFIELHRKKIVSRLDVGFALGNSDQIMKFINIPSEILGTLSSLGMDLEFSTYAVTDEEY